MKDDLEAYEELLYGDERTLQLQQKQWISLGRGGNALVRSPGAT